MILEKIMSKQLAHISYFISSQGEATVIDPRRDHQIYLDLASKLDSSIKYIFETHRNEDYIIGSQELASSTGAPIYHGTSLDFDYGNGVKENDIFQLGSLELKILETPGHTDESLSITMKDKSISPKELFIFTGDALFAGDTGRIDLYGENEKEQLAKKLFHSIHNKIIPLGDDVILLPAHGAGSVCGKNIGELEYTTIGYEKKTNHQLSKNKNEFINIKKAELHTIPPYFIKMEEVNKKGPDIKNHPPFLSSLTVPKFKELLNEGYQILDLRYPSSFGSAHIPKSINIWIDGLSSFAGWFLEYETPILLIDTNNTHINKASKYLFRIGYDNVYGYLKSGFSSWYIHNEPINSIDFWNVSTLNKHINDDSVFILDVREQSTIQSTGSIQNSHFIYVGDLEKKISSIPQDKTIVVYCNSGFQTSIACSVLKRHEFPNVVNLIGGFNAWNQANLPIKKEMK